MNEFCSSGAEKTSHGGVKVKVVDCGKVTEKR